MRTYIVRRLLMMIPTFFGISLLIFAVLNLAPGRPGSQNQAGDVASDARGEATQESIKIFREQFNLDKPIFLNTRFALTTEQVRSDLERAGDVVATPVAERLAARERLEDLGNYAVPHLISVLTSADAGGEVRLRDTAAYFLRLNAPRRLIDPFNPAPDSELRAHNDAVSAESSRLSTLKYAFDAPRRRSAACLTAGNAGTVR